VSNKSSVSGKYLGRIFSPHGNKKGDDKVARYDDMILSKQRKALERKRKQERQNKRKARRK
jgi:hypothetical protein